MPRKCEYEIKVQPHLSEIPTWIAEMSQKEVADKLGITERTFINYKNKYEELRKAVDEDAVPIIVSNGRASIRKRANGFYYKEYKRTYTTTEKGEIIGTIKVEEFEKYCVPDVVAIHLMMKNYDDTWRNDDAQTMELKKQKVEIEKTKAESDDW